MNIKSVSPFNMISFMLQMEGSYQFQNSSCTFNCLQYFSFPFWSDVILVYFAVLILTLNVCSPILNAFPLHVSSGAVRVINWITLQHLLLWLLILCVSSVLLHERMFSQLCIYQQVPAAQTSWLRMLIKTFSAWWLLHFFVLSLMLPIQQSRGI